MSLALDRRAKAFGLLRRHLGLIGVTVEQQAALWRQPRPDPNLNLNPNPNPNPKL